MSQLNKQTIRTLTELSRIKCTEEEEDELLKDLSKILRYFEQLQEIDTEGVTPCNHVIEDVANFMRKDEIGASMPREVFLANAPSHTGGMIRVPPVIQKN